MTYHSAMFRIAVSGLPRVVFLRLRPRVGDEKDEEDVLRGVGGVVVVWLCCCERLLQQRFDAGSYRTATMYNERLSPLASGYIDV